MSDRRMWLVFFGPGHGPGWWKLFLRRGYCHVSVAAWFCDAERWIHLNPASEGLVVEVHTADGFTGRLAQLLRDSTVVVAIPSVEDRRHAPRSWWCVGFVKAVLGVKCGALSPYQLYRHLLQNGGEIAEVPSGFEEGPGSTADDRQGRPERHGRPDC